MNINTSSAATKTAARFSAFLSLIVVVFLLHNCDTVSTDSYSLVGPDGSGGIEDPVDPGSDSTAVSDSSSVDDGSTDDGSTNDGSTDDGSPNDGTSDNEPPPSSPANFAIYDGMNFSDKPGAITQAGVKSIVVHYSAAIFGISARDLPGTMFLPDKDQVQQLARQTAASGAGIGVIDIEHWPTQGSPAEIQQAVDNLLTVLGWFKEAAPNVQWGYYGEVPIRNYWDAIDPISSESYQGWMAANDKLQAVAGQADILFPSVYTFYDRPEQWVTYAKAQIAEARRLNPDAKVIVYLWPVYHMSNKNGLAGQLIDAEFWRLQLETCRKYADGVAIYASSGFDFDTSQAWWQVTKEFIQGLEG